MSHMQPVCKHVGPLHEFQQHNILHMILTYVSTYSDEPLHDGKDSIDDDISSISDGARPEHLLAVEAVVAV